MTAQVMKFTHGTVIFLAEEKWIQWILLVFRGWFCKTQAEYWELTAVLQIGQLIWTGVEDLYTNFDFQTFKIRIFFVSPVTFCISDSGSSEGWIGEGVTG